MEKRAKIRFFAEQATQIILDMPSNSDMSDLGKTSKEQLNHTETLTLEIINVIDDEEVEVYESKTDTEERANGTSYKILGKTY